MLSVHTVGITSNQSRLVLSKLGHQYFGNKSGLVCLTVRQELQKMINNAINMHDKICQISFQ